MEKVVHDVLLVSQKGLLVAERIELLASGGSRMRDVLGVVRPAFERARAVAGARLHARDIDVHVIDAADECIPEWGIGGSTYGPHSIVLAVDPAQVISPANVFTTLVHELHHVMRWRGPGCGSSLGERLVSEGLAVVFEEECAGGSVPLLAEGGLSEDHVALAEAALGEDPADEGRWFFGGGDLPRWFGYRLGYQVVKEELSRRGGSAAQLVHASAAQFWR